MIALDANVLIAYADSEDALHERVISTVLDVDEALVCSTISMAEALVRPAKDGKLSTARTSFGRLGVMEVGLPADAAVRLATLRAETGLRLPDCCVLLAAEEAGAKRVLTFDARLAEAASARGL